MMKIDRDRYDLLASLFDYPAEDLPTLVEEACESLHASYPEAAEEFRAFQRLLPFEGCETQGHGTERVVGNRREEGYALDAMQELYTRSFQVQAMTTLDIGYIIFGDDYKRAELLVNLNREHREADVSCGNELPDHLPNLLRLLPRWRDSETMIEFVQEILAPALEMMIGEFAAERVEQRNALYKKHYKTLIAVPSDHAMAYKHALVGLLRVVAADFDVKARERRELSSDFLKSIRREMEIEARGEGHRVLQTEG